MVCTGLLLLLESALFAGTVGHLVPDGGSVGGDGVVAGKVLVGKGGLRRVKVLVLLQPGYPSVTMVVRAPLQGSRASLGGVSVKCSLGLAGDLVGEQPLGRGPRSSLSSGHLRFPFVESVV